MAEGHSLRPRVLSRLAMNVDNILSRVTWMLKDVARLGPFGRFPRKDRKIWAIWIH